MGPYELDKRIGRGGMGEVFQARSTHLGGLQRSWAIKIVSRRKLGVHFDKIRREAEVGMMLGGHNNIAATLDFGEDPASGLVYIVTEFIDGLDLAQFADAAEAFGHIVCDDDGQSRYCNVLTLELVVFLVVEIARGLHHAHRITHARINQKIVHRDLKPRNVMVGLGGEVKIVDYGIASRVGAAPSSCIAGTPAYMAPEQYRGEPVTQQADLYSLGVIFYELLTGANPWAGLPENALHEDLLRRAAPPALALQELAVLVREGLDARGDPVLRGMRTDELPHEVTAVLFGLLGPSPASRIGSALDVIQTLTQWSGYRDMREELQRAVSFFKQKDAPSTNTTFHPEEGRVAVCNRSATTRRGPLHPVGSVNPAIAAIGAAIPGRPGLMQVTVRQKIAEPEITGPERVAELRTTRIPRASEGAWTRFSRGGGVAQVVEPDAPAVQGPPEAARVSTSYAPTTRFNPRLRDRTAKVPAPEPFEASPGSIRSGAWGYASAYAWMPLVGIALGTAVFVIVDTVDRVARDVPPPAVAMTEEVRLEDLGNVASPPTAIPVFTEEETPVAVALSEPVEALGPIEPPRPLPPPDPFTPEPAPADPRLHEDLRGSPGPEAAQRARAEQAKRVAESLDCLVFRTETAATRDFERVLRNVRRRHCWVGHERERRRRHTAALFELGRFEDCIAVSHRWHDPVVESVRETCRIRIQGGAKPRPRGKTVPSVTP